MSSVQDRPASSIAIDVIKDKKGPALRHATIRSDISTRMAPGARMAFARVLGSECGAEPWGKLKRQLQPNDIAVKVMSEFGSQL
jgi:hypothetical protein